MIKTMTRLSPLILLCLMNSYAESAHGAESEGVLPVGEIVERVTCQKKPDYSYALYLPSGYDPEQTWPIVWGLSPGGGGLRPVERLQEAAERYGYIVVGSHDWKNGPWAPNDLALEAMWKDVEARFSIDPERHYGAGFSGGARAALDLALRKKKRFAGVILCGAVSSPRHALPRSSDLAIVGLVGDGDIALAEHLEEEQLLADRGYTQWHEVFAGTHVWPPQELFTDAVELFQAVAMQRGELPRDSDFLQQLITDRLARGEFLQEVGRPLLALRTYRQTAALFAGEPVAGQAAERAAALEQNPKMSSLQAEEDLFLAAIANLSDLTTGKYVESVGALKAWKASSGRYSRRADNVLQLWVRHLQPSGLSALQRGDLTRARILFLIAHHAYPENPASAYNAACALARLGDNEKALLFLKDAAIHRFNNPELLRTDSDLKRVRDEPGFAEIVSTVQRNQEQGLAPPPYPSEAIPFELEAGYH